MGRRPVRSGVRPRAVRNRLPIVGYGRGRRCVRLAHAVGTIQGGAVREYWRCRPVAAARAFGNRTIVRLKCVNGAPRGMYLLKNGSGRIVSTDSRTAATRGSLVSEDAWLFSK